MELAFSSIADVAGYASSNVIVTETYSTTPRTVDRDAVEIPCYIYWYNQYIAIPIICIAGLVANTISGVVVVRSGLKKPSNIFLFSLAIADSMILIKVLHVPEYLYLIPNKYFKQCNVLHLPYTQAVAVWIFGVALYIIYSFGGRLSSTLIVVITLERLLAVFFPLKFSRMMTSKRAFQIVVCSVIFWLPWSTFQCFWFKLHHEYNETIHMYIGKEENTDYLNGKNFDTSYFSGTVINHLVNSIPLALVVFGCTCIGIKITISSRQRRKLLSTTAKQRSSSRTTKTLLMVCLGYALTRSSYMFRYLMWFDDGDPERVMSAIIYILVRDRLTDLNSACNFFIYVAFNKQFRHILNNLCFSCYKTK